LRWRRRALSGENSPPIHHRRFWIGLVSLESYRKATASSEGGRNSLLESAQEATITSLAISASEGQTSGCLTSLVLQKGKTELDPLKYKAETPAQYGSESQLLTTLP
jgi:hypothetical protein